MPCSNGRSPTPVVGAASRAPSCPDDGLGHDSTVGSGGISSPVGLRPALEGGRMDENICEQCGTRNEPGRAVLRRVPVVPALGTGNQPRPTSTPIPERRRLSADAAARQLSTVGAAGSAASGDSTENGVGRAAGGRHDRHAEPESRANQTDPPVRSGRRRSPTLGRASAPADEACGSSSNRPPSRWCPAATRSASRCRSTTCRRSSTPSG